MARFRKDWIKSYQEYGEPYEAPTSYHTWVAVSTIAGAMRRRVWLDCEDWKWHPNFFIVLVGPPGEATKSFAAGMGMKLLEETPGINMSPTSTTWQALVDCLAESAEGMFIGKGIHAQIVEQSAVTAFIPEFGTFLPPASEEANQILCDLYDCRRTFHRRTRKDGPIKINGPCLNLLGGTTAAWIKDFFEEKFFFTGLASRMIFVYEEKKSKLVMYPFRTMDRGAHKTLRKELLNDLQEIARIAGEYEMTEESFAKGERFHAENYELGKKNWKHEPKMMGWVARKPTHVHKLAMIRAASLRDERIILPEDMTWAINLVDGEVEDNLNHIVNLVAIDSIERRQEAIATKLAEFGECDMRKLYREFRDRLPFEEFLKATEALQKLRLISITVESADVTMYHPTRWLDAWIARRAQE